MADPQNLGHKKLTLPRRIAVNAYLAGATKREAMNEAGYAENVQMSLVFNRPDVQHEIERLSEQVMAKYEVSREWITEQLVNIATAGETLAKFKKVMPDGLLDWDFTGATQQELALIETLAIERQTSPGGVTTTRFKPTMPSRQTALDSLCRIHGFNKDKLDLGGEMSLVERLQRGRDRAKTAIEQGSDDEEVRSDTG